MTGEKGMEGRTRSGKGPVARLIDTVAGVWFGVSMMVLVLIYCWIGSAGFAPFSDWFVRQSFEKTEMEWFSWWPFGVLLAVFSLSLVLATIRRAGLRREKLGVWVTHGGILVLIIGAVVYFGHKQEGDMLLYRREAVLRVEGGEPSVLTLRPGDEAVVEGPGRHYHVRVAELNPHYTLLTGPDAGKEAYAATLEVEPVVEGEPVAPFLRQLLVGYPEFTEDVLPGQGRAVKVLGRPLVDEALTADLRYAASDRIYLRDRPALDARWAGEEAWTEFPLRGLPHYGERVAAGTTVIRASGEKPPRTRGLDLRPQAKKGAPDLDPRLSFRITGFLPYARLEEGWEPGGVLNPYLRFTMRAGKTSITRELLALDPEQDRLDTGMFNVYFRWVLGEADLERLIHPAPPRLVVTVPGRGVTQALPMERVLGQEVAIAGTGYRVECEQVFPRWTLAGGGRAGETASMALVRVTGPRGTFRRAVVFPQVELSQDLDAEGMRHQDLLDPGIHIELENVVLTGMSFVAEPGGLHALVTGQNGEVAHQEVRVGEPFEFFNGHLQVTVEDFIPDARPVLRPVVTPLAERDRRAGETYSLIQVEIADGDSTRSTWLEFSPYAHPSRMGFFPRVVTLADGRELELVYSEETLRLPAPVALEDFQLETYPGQTRERDYISRVRFLEGGRWSDPVLVHSNHPAEHGGWSFFQSTWDPPEPEANYAGLNHTGLGVGNGRGIGLMGLGAVLSVLGSLLAFYGKPFLRRRTAAEAARPPSPAAPVGVAMLAAALLAAAVPARAAEEPVPLSVGPEFAAQVDLDAIRLVAVQDEGRVKTFDSLAREKLKYVNARASRRLDPVLLYLDMMLAPDHYAGANVIYVRKPVIRQEIVRKVRSLVPAPERQGPIADAELDRVERTGLVSLEFLDHATVRAVLSDMERDVMRTSKEVQALYSARTVADATWLTRTWRVIPPPGGSELAPWFSPLDLAGGRMPGDAMHAGMSGGGGGGVPGLAAETAAALQRDWQALQAAWTGRDAAGASAALRALAAALPQVEPRLYPSSSRLRWEHWYYSRQKLTASWIFYFLALPFLLTAVVYRLRWARVTGLVLFGLGFAAHTFSLGLRWYLAQRIPNANMFEAILASAWFGGLAAIVLEIVLRRRSVTNLPALAASTYAMGALLCGHFMPVALNSDISTLMPVLDRTVWLYIHTNMIIASYAVIFFAAVTAVLYLVGRGVGALAPASAFSAAWRGAGGFVAGRFGAGPSAPAGAGRAEEAGLSRSLDAMTMIFLQLAFVTLWVGTLLGAVWAAASWGRPWGWDPKEVFALNTWLVLLVLVHVRLKVQDKGLWTAVLALVATAVMLFNWIAVNFVITGLHSYA